MAQSAEVRDSRGLEIRRRKASKSELRLLPLHWDRGDNGAGGDNISARACDEPRNRWLSGERSEGAVARC